MTRENTKDMLRCYEGTTQLQVVAAVRGVCSKTAKKIIGELSQHDFDPQLKDLLDKLAEGTKHLKDAVEFIK